MKLMPLSRASFTICVVCSWPRLPIFILPPNCIVPKATSLTMSPVFPSFRYFILQSPCFACSERRQIHVERWALTRLPCARPQLTSILIRKHAKGHFGLILGIAYSEFFHADREPIVAAYPRNPAQARDDIRP